MAFPTMEHNDRTSCYHVKYTTPSRINPKKLAYYQLHGRRYYCNRFPLAPPGTRAVLYLDPDNRSSWGTRGIDACYCGPYNDHYRCNKFYVPETRSYRISGSFDLFPQNCSLPDMSPEQHTNAVHDELLQSIMVLKKPHKKKLLKRMADALYKLATSQEAAPIQRVSEAELSRKQNQFKV